MVDRNDSIEDLEIQTFEEDDTPDVPPPEIVAYNELRSCADLFRMKTTKILDIQPEFQREIVWKKPAQTRFIDSLIKQLPIPSMCFSYDFASQQWKVIDGLQRISSICNFLSGEMGLLSKLDDIDPTISGQPISAFKDEKSKLHNFFTRVENLSLPITVIRCNYSNKNHMNYLFTIFHRLNAGGTRLNNQEIRNCIFSGPFNDLLNKLNAYDSWKKLNKMKRDVGYRFRKQELILRLFTFHDHFEDYKGKLAKFLNEYMDDWKLATPQELSNKEALFMSTVNLIWLKLFEQNLSQPLSTTVLEALLVGVSRNIPSLEALSHQQLFARYNELISLDEFKEEKIREGLAKTNRVQGRLLAAVKIFKV